MSSLAEAFRSHLLNDIAISAAVGGWRIFSDRPPQNAETPMIVFFVVSEVTQDGLNCVPDTDLARVQTDTYGKTRTEANSLRKQVRNYLAGTRIQVGDVYLRISRDGGQTYRVDRPESGGDQYRYISQQDFLVAHNAGSPSI